MTINGMNNISIMQGRFITVEGGEGSGKTTQIRLLMRAFAQSGLATLHTREPGGTEGAEAIRALLLRGDAEKWDDVAELLLFYAARREHLARVVWPALEAGTTVICDRFADSTRVYQGYGKGLGDDYVTALHRLTLGNFQPDLTLWLDMDVKAGLYRATSRAGDEEQRFERMQGGFHDRVRAGFETLARKEPQRIVHVDASGSIAAVHEQIITALNARLGFHLAIQPEEA